MKEKGSGIFIIMKHAQYILNNQERYNLIILCDKELLGIIIPFYE